MSGAPAPAFETLAGRGHARAAQRRARGVRSEKGKARSGAALQRRQERAAASCEPRFPTGRAVAVSTPPGLGSILIAATAARMRILDLLEIEVLGPVFTLFRQRCCTVADFHPLDATVCVLAGIGHVAKVLVAGNRSLAQRFVVDRSTKR